MENLLAVLFCGGRGSRLYPITDFYQKVMIPIGKSGKPLLEYVINHLKKSGITEFVALVGYRNNLIQRYFGDGSKWEITITYVIDSENYKGTGGALYNARNRLTKNHWLIYYTDILTNLNIQELYKEFQSNAKKGLIWVDDSWKIEDGSVEVDMNDMVTEIATRPKKKIYANTGISILDASVLEIIEDLVNNQNKKNIDLSSDIIPKLVDNQQIAAYDENHWWIDIGSLKRYRQLTNDVIEEIFGE
ncbi:MAG: nucleotidyltransferase family protein [Candidatus Heimdallarchaeota archaeon]|nr:nucleotidyltransferase family protein [Candidatus Heimdallarchaeota archaeon]